MEVYVSIAGDRFTGPDAGHGSAQERVKIGFLDVQGLYRVSAG